MFEPGDLIEWKIETGLFKGVYREPIENVDLRLQCYNVYCSYGTDKIPFNDCKKVEPRVLATWVMCPDGTMLPSFHNHDYRQHTTIDLQILEHPDECPEPDFFSEDWQQWRDQANFVVKESRYTMVDGGSNYYGRRGGVYTEMSVYETDSFEVIRRFLCRGGRGKNSDEPLTWTPLFRINDDWLENLIKYETDGNPENFYLKFYKLEKNYRKDNHIEVK